MAKRDISTPADCAASHDALLRRLAMRLACAPIPADPGLRQGTFDELMTQVLAEVGGFLAADRGYVVALTDAGETLTNTHEWTAQGVQHAIERLQGAPMDLFAWTRERLGQRRVVLINDVDDMPPEACPEQEEFRHQRILSLLFAPLACGETLLGFVGFDMVRHRRQWRREETQLVRAIGELLGGLHQRNALLESQNRRIAGLETLRRAAADGWWETPPHAETLSASMGVTRLLGVPHDELARCRDFPLPYSHPEDLAGAARRYEAFLHHGGRLELRLRLRAADGGWFPALCRMVFQDIDEERRGGLFGVLIDLRTTEDASAGLPTTSQADQPDHYRRLFEMEPDAVILADAETMRILDVNPAAAALYGYTREEFLTMTCAELSAAPEATAFAIGERTVFNMRQHRRKDGREFPVEALVRYFPLGDHEALLAIIHDATTRRRAQEKLEHERRFLRQVIDTAPSIIFVKDEQGRVQLANAAACRLLDAPESAMLGVDSREIYPDAALGDAIYEEDLQLLSGETPRLETEHLVTNQRGESRVMRSVKVPVLNPRGVIVGVLSVGRDVSVEKRLKTQVARAAHLASLGEVAAGLAHEINNPINGVINYAQMTIDLLQEDEAATADDRRVVILNRIVHEGERIARLVAGLLSYSRPRDGASSCHLVEALASAMGLLESRLRKEAIAIEIDIPPGTPALRCSGWELQQVLINLVSNARYALNQRFPGPPPPGEEKRMRLAARPLPSATEPDAPLLVQVTLEDTGVGAPEEVRELALTPFFTTKPEGEGTGLGLAICLAIVERHGGALRLEGAEGPGARVVITLPAA